MVKNIPGYSIKNVLYSGKSLILNANREKDGFPVVIKLPSSEYPSQTDWLKLKKEFSIGTKLNHEGITKYLELVSHNNGYALIMEKLEKMTLSAYLKQSKFHLESLLKISISLCEIFQYIHLQGVIHKDIKPDNIIIEPDTLKIKILDFGIASDVGRDIETNIPTKMLAGTLAYISPEQTGRMNRSVDNRSDIYSLGITFYEMFSGSPPFTTVDSLEMLHFHMAKPAPVINNEKIPSIVDKIIQKMILKNPEERYKSCLGIQKDLTRVLESIQKGETPKDFHLGSEDYSTTLLIPEKLYGRTGDIIKLNKVFKSVSSGKSKLLLVSGYSGIGKSGLIGEVQKPLVEERGFFISGKFDQFQKNLPYKGLIFAFQDLISQLLISDQSSIDSWKIKILESIQNNGKILTDVIPDLELLIGKQPEVSELDPVQSQNRFNLVFENFIKSISSAEIPLVIFLDDLQWADKSTLNLLEVIFSGTDIEGLLVIGAFRDNEVDEAHPLKITLSNLSKEGFEAEEIHLSPLTLKDVTELVIDCLSLNREDSLKLAEVVHSKSGGNPFFLRLLLQNMWVNHFINQNEKGNWSIDFSGISGMEITDNVIDLAIKKIQSTDNDIFDLLTFSSCIGYKFESGILAQLFNKAEEEIQNILKKGLREELLTVQNEGELVEYRFIHDRIQQAYYSLLTDDQLVNFHYKIGNYFLEKGSEKEIEEAIFDITDHLNKSISVINNSDELEKLLNLNLKTGHKAKVSSAYQASLSYFQNAIKCLEKLTSNSNIWDKYYEKSFEAYSEGAEVSLLAADFEKMIQLSEFALKNSKKLLDRVRIFEIRINYHSQINELEKAVSSAVSIVNELNVKLPENAKLVDIFSYLFKAKFALGRKSTEDLYHFKKLNNPELSYAMKIIMTASSAAYFTSAEMLTCMLLRGVALSAKYGNTVYSIYFYAGYGLILCGALFDLKGGNQFADLAMQLLDKFNANEVRCRVTFLVHAFSHHWMHNLAESLDPLLEAYSIGLQNGDLEYAAGAMLFHKMYSLNLGEELENLEKETRAANAQMLKTKQLRNRNSNLILHQVMLNLLGRSEHPEILTGESFNEEEGLKTAIEIKDMMAASWILLYKAILCYLFGKKEEALKAIQDCDEYEPGILAQYLVVLKNFYSSLIHIANVKNPELDKVLIKKAKKNQKKLKSWMKSFPENIEHKFLLVEAELARIENKKEIAGEIYENAVACAERNGYINEIALCNELAGNFYNSIKKFKFSNLFFSEAKFRYGQWGAKAKVKKMEEELPNLMEIKRNYKTDGNTFNAETTSMFSETKTANLALFDVVSIMRAAQSISGEIQLEVLLEKLINLAVENAGAEKGFLILLSDGKKLIQAYQDLSSDKIQTLKALPLTGLVPVSIINYTINKKEPVVLINAMKYGNFIKDEFIVSHQTISVLCIPLVNQGKLNGLIYLENNKIEGAFTPDRVEVLRTISSQASISIENAMLYENLSTLNKAYERFVPKQFLETLGKKTVIEVKLGDNVEKKATVFFSDIRSFTNLSEKMTPEENFRFINSYLKYMEPVINRHSGFIDKYIGDAIMALFPTNAEDAIKASIEMQKALLDYNDHRNNSGYEPIEVGMGLNTGELILGTVGGEFRMDGTVISDSVNLASRIEGLTKYFGANIIISEYCLNDVINPSIFNYRFLGRVKVKGKSNGIGIIEILDGKKEEELKYFLNTLKTFQEAYENYTKMKFKNALEGFEEVIKLNQFDRTAKLYKQRTIFNIQNGVPDDWIGIEEMDQK